MMNNNEVFIIMAADENLGIGKNNSLPWLLKEELKYFQTTTTNTLNPDKENAIIMGRKTWESIPKKHRPLRNRLNIVLTRNKDYKAEGAIVFSSLNSALNSVRDNIEKIFIIGGANIFKEAIKLKELDGIYLTQINHKFDCDTFLDPIPDKFNKVKKIASNKEADINYDYMLYRK